MTLVQVRIDQRVRGWWCPAASLGLPLNWSLRYAALEGSEGDVLFGFASDAELGRTTRTPRAVTDLVVAFARGRGTWSQPETPVHYMMHKRCLTRSMADSDIEQF